MIKFVQFFAAAFPFLQAHSWIDCISTSMNYIDRKHGSDEWVYGGQKNNGQCEGYAAGYPSRGSNIIIDRMFTYKLGMDEMKDGTADVCQKEWYQPGAGQIRPP